MAEEFSVEWDTHYGETVNLCKSDATFFEALDCYHDAVKRLVLDEGESLRLVVDSDARSHTLYSTGDL